MVIIIIVLIIESRKELVTPISVPHSAWTDANFHPEEDNQNTAFSPAELLYPCALADIKTVKNFATSDIVQKLLQGL
ncbi:MAG TPA: hypothetical protein VH415_00860 [Nitrososphaeraceae archaeon]